MDMTLLATLLGMQRGHNSEGEMVAVRTIMNYLGVPHTVDASGNFSYTIGKSRTLFAAHCDTVHYNTGVTPNQYKLLNAKGQRIKGTDAKAWARAVKVKAVKTALGADDGAGVALLAHMIRHKIPGTYLFTRGEECGGIGASFVAENRDDWLRQFDRAICFDRRGTDEVIITQGWGDCASEEFGMAVSVALSDLGLLYAPSHDGIYTDCKEWREAISECINISVGYQHEHGSRETLDLVHYRALAEAVLKIDWEGLRAVRDPSEDDMHWTPLRASKGKAKGKGKSEEEESVEYRFALQEAQKGVFLPLRALVCAAFECDQRLTWYDLTDKDWLQLRLATPSEGLSMAFDWADIASDWPEVASNDVVLGVLDEGKSPEKLAGESKPH